MIKVRETIFHHFQDLLVIVNAKDVQGTLRWDWSLVPARLMDGLRTWPGTLRRVRQRITRQFRTGE